MASTDGHGARGKGTMPGVGPAAPAQKIDGHARTAYGEFVPAPAAPLARGFHPAPTPAARPAAAPPAPVAPPAMPQPFPHPAQTSGQGTGANSRFIPAQPAPGPAFSTSRTMTPAGEITAVGAHAPGVQATSSSGDWNRPSETPTQIGEPSGVRSLAGDPGTGVMTGQTLGERYRVVRKIGSGGMGEVWEAQHIVIKKAVAVKVLTLDPSVTNGAEQAERLMREARLVASVRHDNVVDITDFGHTPMGAPYFVMELLSGETLKKVVEQQGAVPWRRGRDILMQITDALAAAHHAGIIHRDIKPENVFLVQRGGREVVKLIDFGIAKTTLLGDDGMTLTKTGMVCGTPAFMSPEQARGEKIDERTDIYSLGCLAYQMLAGRQPFVANSPAEALYQQLFVEPTPMRQVVPHADLPQNLDAIVLTCMRKNRNLRFQSMEDIHRALENLEHTSAALVVPHEDIPAPPKEVQTRFASVSPGMTFTDERYDTLAGGVAPRAGSGVLVAGILGGALLLGAGGGAGYYFLVHKPGLTDPGSEAVKAVEAAPESEEPTAPEPASTDAVVEPEVESPDEAVVPTPDEPSPEPLVENAAAGSPASRPSKGSKGPAPIEIEAPPIYYDKDHVADGQGPEEKLPPPPLPDAEPDAPEPKPEPPPAPPIDEPPDEKKPDGKKKVDDLRDPWERG